MMAPIFAQHHIAFLSTNNVLPWGGSEELWYHTARHMLSRGWKVAASVYTWPQQPKQILDFVAAGGNLFTFDRTRSFRSRLFSKLGLNRSDQYDWLDRAKPELVVISSIGHPVGRKEAQACRDRKIPYVILIEAATETHWWSDQDLELIYDAYIHATMVCFVSESNRQLVERQFGRPLPNACIVRNPFNIRYDANPAWPDMSSGLRLACVGRFDPHHKGQDLIVEVFNRPQWRERQLSVTLVGRGPSESGLRRLVEWRKAAIHFQAFTNDIEQVWATHHALILPSRAEGLPLALVEALLCNRMAIVTDVAGNAEMVEEGVTGFVAPAPTVDLLDAALERAWARRAEWQTMGAEAGRRVRNMVPPDPASVFADFVEKTAAAIVH